MLKQLIRTSLRLAGVFSLFFTSLPTFASINDAEAINKAGLQRMLSQRVAKNYIMMGSDVNPDTAAKEMDKSMALFEQQYLELQEYAPTAEIEESLNKVATIWQDYRLKVLHAPTKENALTIIALSDQLLAESEKVEQQIAIHANRQAGQLVNMSGRQRMLSQRIAKLYIARAWGIKDESIDTNLHTAIDEFDDALKKLQQSELNTPEINKKLAKVQNQWDFTSVSFRISHEGQFVPNMVSVTTESILKKMNDLTKNYEQLMLKSTL